MYQTPTDISIQKNIVQLIFASAATSFLFLFEKAIPCTEKVFLAVAMFRAKAVVVVIFSFKMPNALHVFLLKYIYRVLNLKDPF